MKRRTVILPILLAAGMLWWIFRDDPGAGETAESDREPQKTAFEQADSSVPTGLSPSVSTAVLDRATTDGKTTGPLRPHQLIESSFARQRSVEKPAQLFDRRRRMDFSRQLSGPARKLAVHLASRSFVPGTPQSVPAGEFYLTFSKTPDDDVRAALNESGIRLVEHITRTTWRAVAEKQTDFGAIDSLQGAEPVWAVDKWSPRLWARYRNGTSESTPIDAMVSFTAKTSFEQASALLKAAGTTAVGSSFQYGQKLKIRVRYDELLSLCGSVQVSSAELPPPPRKTFNLNAAKLSNVDDIQAAPYGLSGTNINIMLRDGGEVALHPDYNGRVTMVETSSVHYHATHVAGTLAGNGSGYAAAKGMAPRSQIYSYDFYGDDASELLDAKNNHNVLLSNHSYGYRIGWEGSTWYNNTSLFGDYTTDTRTWDAVVKDHQLYVFKAAGNDRNDDGDGHPHDGTFYGNDYYDCMETVSGAKNIITVGAVDASGAMSTFSNFGPTDDGRIKPDIVSDGVAVISTWTNLNYVSMNGTSMATPVACGASALLLEQYRALHGNAWPSVAYLKGLLIHTARDRGLLGPDYAFGWGLLDVKAAADLLRTNAVRIAEDVVTESQTNRYQLSVPEGSENLRVTLYWTDPEGSTVAADALVNDLDLRVITPDDSSVYYPYVMPFAADGSSPTNKAVTGTNQWDNTEQIEISSATGGVWTLQVNGTVVPAGSQAYVLLVSTGNIGNPDLRISSSNLSFSAVADTQDSAGLVVSNAGDGDLNFSISDSLNSDTYTWKDSDDPDGPAYTWIDISDLGSAVSLGDDGESSMLDIGFDFPFYDSTYSRFQIGANGGISFSSGELSYSHENLPSSSAPSQSLLAMWDDLNPKSAGSIRYHSTAERLVVSWLGVPFYSSTDTQTFQIILYPDGRIVYQYQTLNGNISSCTVGLQADNAAGPVTQVAYNESYLKNSLAIEFTPPEEPWLSYTPLSGSVSPGSSTSVIVTASATSLTEGVYTALATIASNDPETPAISLPITFTVLTDDTDSDGLPDVWETQYFGDATNALASADPDGDDYTNEEEYVAGLNPTNADQFVMTQLDGQGAALEDLVLRWPAVSGRVYTIYWSSNLLSPFSLLQSNVTGGVFTDSVHSAGEDGFYRIEVDLAP